jgi:opacity protein-like surface antigen
MVKFQSTKKSTFFVLLLCLTSSAWAAEEGWYIGANFGAMLSDDVSTVSTGTAAPGEWKVSPETGFSAGLQGGYRFGNNWRADFGWTYGSTDSQTRDITTSSVFGGDYASSLLNFGASYEWESLGAWRPFVSAGAIWSQEVDLDLESPTGNYSFSGDGEFGYYLGAGVLYTLTQSWGLNLEWRWISLSGLELEGEDQTSGKVNSIYYEGSNFRIGIEYRF